MSAVTERHPHPPGVAPLRHVRIAIEGAVQGVGFRPFVYRLAGSLGIRGWVRNSPAGVQIAAQAQADTIERFIIRLRTELPPHACIRHLKVNEHPLAQFERFDVVMTSAAGELRATALPDLATCPDCLHELLDPNNRRYRYPFINCTNCGPRYTIIEALPYDRASTSMHSFVMCDDCRAEYDNPANRRFHAQPNACPVCGPRLQLLDRNGACLEQHDGALIATAGAIRNGLIVALKGLGGYQLIVDARNEDAVRTLRERKRRQAKPLATMYPSIDSVLDEYIVSEAEQRLLTSAAAPIVLLERLPAQTPANRRIADSVAPGNPFVGVMLPYTPLHHLLMHELGFPIVATSGNRSDEPICIDDAEASQRLAGIADLHLTHNRPIVRPVDDSVARVCMDTPMILRAARGYTPMVIALPSIASALAVGAQQKATVAVSRPEQILLSQHIGDLETIEARRHYDRTVTAMLSLHDVSPVAAACDLHPDYHSTHHAHGSDMPTVSVQHHYAHALACMTEHSLTAPVTAVVWDGTGLGTDGSIWGGEFLRISETSFERVAHLRTFRLPGGDAASRDARRPALALLYEVFGGRLTDVPELSTLSALTPHEAEIILAMLARDINCPVTSSAGRLFDALASLTGIAHRSRFESETAMLFEFAAMRSDDINSYELSIDTSRQPYVLDWRPMVTAVVQDVHSGISPDRIAARCHHTLSRMIAETVRTLGEKTVVLAGGCFQNRLLLTQTARHLRHTGHSVFWSQQIPINDGGISVGQLAAWQRMQKKDT